MTPTILSRRANACQRSTDARPVEHVDLVERPAGTVAAELRWAIVGAIDTTTDRHA
jgi:hypothetical protein